MNSFSAWDTPNIKPLADFTDKSIQRYMVSPDALEIDKDKLDTVLEELEKLRGKGRDCQAKSACTYLRLAQGEHRPPTLSQAECYHRAGNDLRGVDALDKSAQCYAAAAAAAFNELPLQYTSEDSQRKRVDKVLSLALRSAGRAKAQFAAIGMDDESSSAHRLQQEVCRRRMHLQRSSLRHLMSVWRGVTGYGTSAQQWFVWLLASLCVFAALYWILAATEGIKLANGASFTPIVTPLYLSVVNLAAFGTYTQIVPNHILAELVLIAQSISSFILLGTGVTFLVRK